MHVQRKECLSQICPQLIQTTNLVSNLVPDGEIGTSVRQARDYEQILYLDIWDTNKPRNLLPFVEHTHIHIHSPQDLLLFSHLCCVFKSIYSIQVYWPTFYMHFLSLTCLIIQLKIQITLWVVKLSSLCNCIPPIICTPLVLNILLTTPFLNRLFSLINSIIRFQANLKQLVKLQSLFKLCILIVHCL
jgi:hypothetical protein